MKYIKAISFKELTIKLYFVKLQFFGVFEEKLIAPPEAFPNKIEVEDLKMQIWSK